MKFSLLITALFIIFSGCSEDFVPKPAGYFRIDFPKKEYRPYNADVPYFFEYPEYAIIRPDTVKKAEPYWINIDIPIFKASIYISFKAIKKNDSALTEDSRKLAYKHSIMADAINEKQYVDNENKVYGVLYDIKGNVASSIQFYLTDSVKNFLRGALYFNSSPNKDSLSPVIGFIRKDIDHLIQTLRWKEVAAGKRKK